MQPLPYSNDLLEAAKASRAHAYAPYSQYLVGAAIRGADGNAYVGCNVENASYGVTVCAERNALGAMVAAGCRLVAEVVVVTADRGTPCGICRQALAEFSEKETLIHCFDDQGGVQSFTMGELLPHAFTLRKT